MNWPNRLSIIRVLCVPLLVILMMLPLPWCRGVAAAVFCLASLTDFLDGYLARKYHWVTDFGKFIDPVADKLLVLSVFILLTGKGLFPGWAAVLILARELSIDGLRLVAMTRQKVIAAGHLGKIKTFSQMILILLLLITQEAAFAHWYTAVPAVWVLFITLWSAFDYFRKNLSVFHPDS